MVETEAIGTVTSSRAAAGRRESSCRTPLAPVKSPYQVVKPMCDRLNSTRVWLGSTL